jgi:hypothetical protein
MLNNPSSGCASPVGTLGDTGALKALCPASGGRGAPWESVARGKRVGGKSAAHAGAGWLRLIPERVGTFYDDLRRHVCVCCSHLHTGGLSNSVDKSTQQSEMPRGKALEAADRSPAAEAKRVADRARDSEARAGREAAGTQKAHQEAVGKRKRETSAERKLKRIEEGTQEAYEEGMAKRKRETGERRKLKRIEEGTQEENLRRLARLRVEQREAAPAKLEKGGALELLDRLVALDVQVCVRVCVCVCAHLLPYPAHTTRTRTRTRRRRRSACFGGGSRAREPGSLVAASLVDRLDSRRGSPIVRL